MRRTGFTLIEVVVASLLLQLMLVGVLGTLARATRLHAEAEETERVIWAAETVLDSLLAQDSIAGGSRAVTASIGVTWVRRGRDVRVSATGARGVSIALVGWWAG